MPDKREYEPRPVPAQASHELRTFLDDELARIAFELNNLGEPGTIGEGIEVGRDFGWRDIIGTPQQPTTGSGKPSFLQIGTTGIFDWSYSTGDEQFYVWHLPHDYVPESALHFHVHWFGAQTSGGYTRWQFDYIHAKGHNQTAFPSASVTSIFAQEQQSTTAYQHMITETAAETVTGLEVDSLIIARVDRIAPVGETDVSGSVFVPVVDLHYQSTNLATANKSPNFYLER